MERTKEWAIAHYGAEVVDLAEALYETDFDKWFWTDLDWLEQRSHLTKAQLKLDRQKKSTHSESN